MSGYLPDVNVIVASVRSDHAHHASARAFLSAAHDQGRACTVPVEVLAAALRILTLPVWQEPETSESAGELLAGWIEAVDAEVVGHPPAAWHVLAEFARTLALSPRSVPDALIAASAIASRSTVVTFDRGFAGYPGLRAEVLV